MHMSFVPAPVQFSLQPNTQTPCSYGILLQPRRRRSRGNQTDHHSYIMNDCPVHRMKHRSKVQVFLPPTQWQTFPPRESPDSCVHCCPFSLLSVLSGQAWIYVHDTCMIQCHVMQCQVGPNAGFRCTGAPRKLIPHVTENYAFRLKFLSE